MRGVFNCVLQRSFRKRGASRRTYDECSERTEGLAQPLAGQEAAPDGLRRKHHSEWLSRARGEACEPVCAPQLLREYRPPLFSAFEILCFPLPVLTQIHAREGFWKGSFWPLICRGELRKRMIMTAHHVQSWDKP